MVRCQAIVTTISKVQEYVETGLARIHDPLNPEILRLILDGFNASDFTKNGVRKFVTDYKAALAKKR
jgi:hypothetical protein